MSDAPRPWRIWCLLRDQLAHVKPVEEALCGRAEFHYDSNWDPAVVLAQRPDLILCVNDYQYDVVRCLDAARTAGIPSLVLQDGILEWRCQHENPLFGAGGGAPQHQPVMADRIACLGNQSARQIAAWGNADKVEVTGMPRLDHLLQRPLVPIRQPATRLLVMTAKNPGFTEAQRAVTLASLRDLKQYLDTRPALQVQWRVSKSVAEPLGVANQLHEVASVELAGQVEQADAVITTLSTAMLEAMVLGRPVAALDYHNVPRFAPTAWTITARDHIAPVVDELLQPAANKLAYQNDCLADCLRHDGPAAPRVATLIEQMIQAPRAARSQSPTASPAAPVLADLYPGQSVFRETDVAALQVRLARAESEIARLRNDRDFWSRLRNRLRRS